MQLWELVDWFMEAAASAASVGTEVALGQSDEQLGRQAGNGPE